MAKYNFAENIRIEPELLTLIEEHERTNAEANAEYILGKGDATPNCDAPNHTLHEEEVDYKIRESSKLNMRKWEANWFPMGDHNLGINKPNEWRRWVGRHSHHMYPTHGRRHAGYHSTYGMDNFIRHIQHSAMSADQDLKDNGFNLKPSNKSYKAIIHHRGGAFLYDYGNHNRTATSEKKYALSNFNAENRLTKNGTGNCPICGTDHHSKVIKVRYHRGHRGDVYNINCGKDNKWYWEDTNIWVVFKAIVKSSTNATWCCREM